MRLLVTASSLFLLLACSSAGGGAAVLNDAGGSGGIGNAAGTKASGGSAGGDEGELPPPEEEDPAGAGGTSASNGGNGSGEAGNDAGGSAGAATNGGTGGSAGKAGGTGGFDPNAPCETEDGWPAQSISFECEVLAQVNAKRAEGATCGGIAYDPVPALKMHPLLRKAARAHAKDMADKDYFDHKSPDGSSSGDRMKAAGYEGTYYGENIAHGQKDPAAVMKSWMNSSGHCKGIMAGKYSHIGIGFAPTTDGDTYWVQDFAAP